MAGKKGKSATEEKKAKDKPKRKPSVDRRLAYDMKRAVKVTDCSRSMLYEEIKARRLKAKKVGRRTIIRREDLKAWLKNLPDLKPSQAAQAEADDDDDDDDED